MKIFLFAAAFVFSSLILLSCKKDNPVPPEQQPQVNLTLEDVSCTEAWIKLSTSNISLPADVELQKDGSFYRTINLIVPDTALYIDSLLPNKTYNFKSIIQSSNQSITSATLPVTTMDTTSHNFTWQTWTFGGQAGSCTLNDVAVIDENNIWAVGEIYLLDTLGQPDPILYNLVVWNGIDWSIKRIPYYYEGQPFYHPILSIFAFGPNDIWFCSNGVIRWDGNQYNPISIPTNIWGPYQMNKIWGTSDNDIYVVGNNGNIAHYQNGLWSRMVSGTNLNINDIWGYNSEQTQEKNIIAVGGNILEGLENIIIQITNGNSVVQLNNEGANYPLSSVWFQNQMNLYAAGSGLYTMNIADTNWKQIPLPNYFIYSIRANDLNDIIVCGGAGYIGHYNGVSWVNYLENGLPQILGNYYSCAIKGNIVCAVAATIDQKAIAVIGTRN